jgi:hypothetical protein
MVKRMQEGGGVTFDIDSPDVNEEAFTTTLETRDNEEGDGDEEQDEVEAED